MTPSTPQKDKLILDDCYQEFIKWAKINLKSWKDDEWRYQKHIKSELGFLSLEEITPLRLERFKTKLLRKGLAPGSVVHCLAIIRRIINKARIWFNYQGPDPFQAIKLPKQDNNRIRFLSKEEANLLLNELKKSSILTHDQALLSLYAGLRFGEIAKLTWADIDFRHGVIHIRDPKSGYKREAFFHPKIEEMLKRRKEQAPKEGKFDSNYYVFPGKNGKKMASVSKTFFRVVEKLKLNENIEDPRHKVVFHTLRHTFASWLALKGVPLYTIKELMGHRSISQTERYAHLIPGHKKNMVQLLD